MALWSKRPQWGVRSRGNAERGSVQDRRGLAVKADNATSVVRAETLPQVFRRRNPVPGEANPRRVADRHR